MKPIWHVTGRYHYLDDFGWHHVDCDVVVAASDHHYAIDEAIRAMAPVQPHSENTELLVVVKLTGDKLALYEAEQAYHFQQLYSNPLFPIAGPSSEGVSTND